MRKGERILFYQLILLPGLLGILLFFISCANTSAQVRQSPSSPSTLHKSILPEQIIRTIHFEIIDQGQFSQIEQKKYVIADSQETWGKLWQQHMAQNVPVHSQEFLIDFAHYMVIGVFLGQRPTGGYSISIQELAETRDKVIVTFVEDIPPPDTMVTQALTSPFQIIKVLKINKPIHFHQNTSH